MAEHAALALIREPHQPEQARSTEIVPATIRIRESTGPAPA